MIYFFLLNIAASLEISNRNRIISENINETGNRIIKSSFIEIHQQHESSTARKILFAQIMLYPACLCIHFSNKLFLFQTKIDTKEA